MSPRSHRKFKDLGGAAAAKLGTSIPKGNGEPWQLWLGYMWAEGWRRPELAAKKGATQARGRLPWRVAKIKLEQASRTIWHVFQTSADCCRDLEERERSESRPPMKPVELKLNLTQSQKERIAAAEQSLTDSLIAHEKLREFWEPGERTGARPTSFDQLTEVRKLDRDIGTTFGP